MTELYEHYQCDNCSGVDCGQDDPEECERLQKVHDDAIRKEERERLASVCRKAIHKDKTGLAESLSKIRTLAKGYDWIPNDEWGDYDYTQRTIKTLQKEVGFLLGELEKISYEGLRDSGERVNEYIKSFEESLRNKEQP